MVTTKQISLIDVLDVDRFQKLGSKLASLPDPDTFKRRVEDDLWQTFTGKQNSDLEKIAYEELPDKSKSIIGYADGEPNEIVPWWLQSFSWTAHSRSEQLTLEKKDDLSKFENFDPRTTTIQRPALKNEYGETEKEIIDVLGALYELYEALDEQIGIENQSTELELPSQIFEIEEQTIRTTNEFENWFNELLQLCPPINDELTTLLMVNTGVGREALDGVISDDVLVQLYELGFSDDRLHESSYYRPLRDLLTLDSVFDLVIPQAEEFEELGGLEAQLYLTWAENYQRDSEEVVDWIDRANSWDPDRLEEGDEPAFGSIAFQAPLRLKYNKPCFVSLSVNSPSSKNQGYSQTSDRDKRREVNRIMKENGILE